MAAITFYSGVDDELLSETEFSHTRCCFWMPCMHSNRLTFSVRSNWWQGITEDGYRCWSPFKRFKEWSELVIGPKFKLFIRRFNKQRSRHKFQYDPTSYLLNFDESGGNLEDDDPPFRNFSMRYSSILVAGKTSAVT